MEEKFEKVVEALCGLAAFIRAEVKKREEAAKGAPQAEHRGKEKSVGYPKTTLLPALVPEDLAHMADLVATEFKLTTDEFREQITKSFVYAIPDRVKLLIEKVVPSLFDEDKMQEAYFAYISTIDHFRRGLKLETSIESDRITASSARVEIQELKDQGEMLLNSIKGNGDESKEIIESLLQSKQKAAGVIADAEKALDIATTKGLAEEFFLSAKEMKASMRDWIYILITALFLGVGSCFGISGLFKLYGDKGSLFGVVQLSDSLAFVAVGAGAWVAWLATKQINQRFRLAEDYAFKATIAKSYEGYKVEAGANEELKARLFGILLSRLDEHPLRFVEQASHGSPWHELLSSMFSKKGITKFWDSPDNVKKVVTALATGWLTGVNPSKEDTNKPT